MDKSIFVNPKYTGKFSPSGGRGKRRKEKERKKKERKKEKKKKKKKRDFPMRLYTHYYTLSSVLLEIFGRDGGRFSSPVIAS